MDSLIVRRLWIIFWVTVLLGVGSVTAVLATANERDIMLRGYVDATQDSNLPYRIPRLGVNAELTQYDTNALPAVFEQMRAAHVTWVRQRVRWSDIEIAPNERVWTQWDHIFEALQTFPDLHLIPVFIGVPEWQRDESAADQTTAPPQDLNAFADFVAQFAARYADQLAVYQLWDEPNLRDSWGGLNPQPADYAALLAATAPAIRAADPGAVVLAAALAPTIETGPFNLNEVIYLRELYALGANVEVDGFAAKPYGFFDSPDDRTIDADVLNFSRVVALRDVMVAHGDGRKPLWISEFGWNSLPSEWSGEASIWGSVSTSEQSAFTLAALNRAEREWPWLGGMILSQWQPAAPPNSALWGFSLVDAQGQFTPLGNALTAYVPVTTATNGLYFAANPNADYSGVWTFSQSLGADIGWVQDSQLDFHFSGRNVSLLLRQGDYEAYLYPTVDGIPANALPLDSSGNAFINLKSDELTTQVAMVPVSQGLGDGAHMLHLVADRGWDQWALVGFAVSSGNLAAPYEAQIAIAGVASIIAAAAALATALQLDWAAGFQPVKRFVQALGITGELILGVITSLAVVVGMFLTWETAVPNIFRRDHVQIGLALLTAGLIYLEPGIILTLGGCAVLFVLLYHRLELGLILAILYAPFFLFPVELLQFAFPMSELIMLITGLAWLLRTLADMGRARREGRVSLQMQPFRLTLIDGAMLAWAALGVVSITWATYRAPAMTELRALILEPVLFYVILRSLNPSRAMLLRLVDTLLAAGALVCVIGLVMFIFGFGAGVITAEGGAERLASVYGSPNNVALFLGRCLPFSLAFTLIHLDRRRRIAAGILTVLFAVTILLTQSAGSLFIGAPAAVVLVLFLVYGRRALLPIGGLLGLGIVGTFIAAQSARFARLLDFSEGTNFFRVRVWESALQIIRSHPITGLGLDQFLYFFRGQYMLPDAWQEPNLSHPHNIVLDYWTRLGIAGVMLLIYTQVVFWRAALRLYRTTRHIDLLGSALVIGTMGAMINILMHGLVDNSIFVHDLAYIFALMMGLIATLRTPELLTNATK
ncbi:MAG: O-antigen ligase family protein [Anaerolineae bacterium]